MKRREPRIRLRDGVWWITYYVREGSRWKRVRHSLRTTDEDEAKKKLVEITYRTNEGTIQRPSRSFLTPLLDEYAKYRTMKVAKNTVATDMGYLRGFIHWLPKDITRLEHITAAIILQYLTEMTSQRQWAKKTWNNCLNAIRGLFKYAVRYKGFVSPDSRHDNPALAVEKMKVPKSPIIFLSDEQIRSQIKSLQGHKQMKAMVATLILAGLRREELTWLTVSDVDFRTRNLRITSKEIAGEEWVAKTNKDRVIPISDDLMAFLEPYEAWRAKKHAKNVWYFPSPRKCRWDPDNFSAKLRALQKKLGMGYDKNGKLKPWGCLEFRHTFATKLLARGRTLAQVAKFMGNSVLICERHYAAYETAGKTEEVSMGIFGTEKPGGDLRIARIQEPESRFPRRAKRA